MFAGKDASRGLAKSSVKPEDALPEWQDLDDKEKKVLEDWVRKTRPLLSLIEVLMQTEIVHILLEAIQHCWKGL